MIQAGKILAAAALFSLFFTTNVKAQKPKLGIGVHAGLPTADDYFNIALGIDVRLQFNVARQLSIPITTGYTHFVSKQRDGVVMLPDGSFSSYKNLDYGYIPVKGGLKYFFDKSGSGMYGLAEVGAAIGVTQQSRVAFLYSPALGYSWSSGLDLGIKYEAISKGVKFTDDNIGEIAIRVAYGFKL